MKRLGAILAGVLAGSFLAGAAFAGEITMNGSTTVLPIAQAAVEKFMADHPDVTVTLSGGGTSNGIKGLLDGTTQIANASRSMKDKEVEDAKAKGVTPVEHKIAMDAIVAIVNPVNPVKDLTIEQLRDIYAGKVANWKEVGGEDKPIAVVGRDTSSGTFETWETLVMKGEKVTPGALVVASSGAMLQTVAKNPLAIGYDGIGYMNDTIKALSIGGIVPSKETAISGTYPVSRALFMYTNGEPQGDIKTFIDFMKSPDGQKIVEQVGFVPLQ